MTPNRSSVWNRIEMVDVVISGWSGISAVRGRCGEPGLAIHADGSMLELLEALGSEIVVQVGGGVHGHPDGSKAGAKALRDVIAGWMADRSLDAVAEGSKEVRAALDTWGREHPK